VAELDLQRAERGPRPERADGERTVLLEPERTALSILIVDDDPAVCGTLGDILKTEGYATTSALSGREAQAACDVEDFGLVILDMNLPDIPGELLLPTLVERLPEVEVVIITGQATLERTIQSVSPNTVGYFLKPFDMDRLLDTVARIAARKRMARENALMQVRLRRGKEEWETTCDAIQDPIAIVYVDGSIQRVNRAFRDRFGLPYQELIGAMDWRVIFDLDAPPAGWEERAVLVDRTASIEERTDLAIPGAFSVSQFPAELGIGRCVVYILRDVTGRKLIESELEESQKALEALLGNLPGMAYRCRYEPARSMEFVSEGCFDLTERNSHDLLAGDSSYTELVHPEDREWIWDEIESSVARRRPFQLIYRIVCPSGATRWVWEQGRGTVKQAGAIETLEGFIADITERHSMQEQTRHQEKMAALGLLAAGVAHEVGNPLASISGVTQTLLRRADDPKVMEKLELIKAHVQRISHIVREMQNFGRPPILDWAPCAIDDILTKAVAMIRFDKRAANVEIDLVTADDLPSTYGIEDQLLQVFLNVLLNALDALNSLGESQTRKLSIVSRRAEPPDEPALIIEFDDAGVGIPRESVGRVFDPFFTTKEVGYGTGLGLAVCYRIVEEHRGRIDINSEPTHGTRVRITLPVLERPPVDA
jgi:PAS domain S-box-containing protein